MDRKLLMGFLQEVDMDFMPYLFQKTDLSAFCDVSVQKWFGRFPKDDVPLSAVFLYIENVQRQRLSDILVPLQNGRGATWNFN